MPTISNRISALFDSTIDNILLKSAEAIANDARANAPTERIKASVAISPIINTPNGKQIEIYVPITQEAAKQGPYAPEARAYELGSGIHGPEHQTYPINARFAPNLVFFWQKANTLFVGKHVDHPGVAARPYLAPAVAKNRNTIIGLLRRGIGSLVRTSIITGFRE